MKRTALVLLLFAFAADAQAAVIHVRPKLAAVLKPDFTPVELSAIASLAPMQSVRLRPSPQYYVLQFDYLMTIEDLVDGQLGFGNVVFNIDLEGIQQAREYPGWIPDGPRPYDTNGGWPGGLIPKWAANFDAGWSAADLKYILIESVPKEFAVDDPRRSLGIPPYEPSYDPLLGIKYNTDGEYIGSTFLEIGGAPGIDGLVTATVLEGSTFNADLLLSAVGTYGGPPANFRIEVVPEPNSLVLLTAMASVLIVYRFMARSLSA